MDVTVDEVLICDNGDITNNVNLVDFSTEKRVRLRTLSVSEHTMPAFQQAVWAVSRKRSNSCHKTLVHTGFTVTKSTYLTQSFLKVDKSSFPTHRNRIPCSNSMRPTLNSRKRDNSYERPYIGQTSTEMTRQWSKHAQYV